MSILQVHGGSCHCLVTRSSQVYTTSKYWRTEHLVPDEKWVTFITFIQRAKTIDQTNKHYELLVTLENNSAVCLSHSFFMGNAAVRVFSVWILHTWLDHVTKWWRLPLALVRWAPIQLFNSKVVHHGKLLGLNKINLIHHN